MMHIMGSRMMLEPQSLGSPYPITCQSCHPTTLLPTIPVTQITCTEKARCQNIDSINITLKIMTAEELWPPEKKTNKKAVIKRWQ